MIIRDNEDIVRSLVLLEMQQLQEDRHEKYETHLLNEWFPLTDLKQQTFVGGFTWTSPPIAQRWMLSNIADNIGAGWCSPAEIARDYIRVKYKRQKATKAQKEAFSIRRFAPLYCKPDIYSDMAYIDIRAAYWSIIQIVGWDVQYFPNRWLGRRSFMNDFPSYKNKLARNCLVSVGLTSPLRVWTGEKLTFIEKANTMPNKAIWALCMDVLHGIADDMLAIGAVYIHTDGYIIPMANLPLAHEILSSWGVSGREKSIGALVAVKSTGNYDMDFTIDPNKAIRFARPFNNINNVYKDFLKPRMSRLSENVPFIYG